MRNIVKALLLGILVFAVLFVPGLLKMGDSLMPAVVVSIVSYIVFAKRTFGRLEGIFAEAAQALQGNPPRFELAVATLEKYRYLSSHQLGIRSQLDTQIGVIYFLQREFTKALPYLKGSGFGHWLGGAMLGVVHYKKKDYPEMRKTFEVLIRRPGAKKQGLVWCLYAYLLLQINDADKAQLILAQGVKHAKDDARVAEALQAVQNGKKLKMRAFKEQWYQFHLERPPVEYQQSGVPARMGRIARRGRW